MTFYIFELLHTFSRTIHNAYGLIIIIIIIVNRKINSPRGGYKHPMTKQRSFIVERKTTLKL